jgi:hypothetical protein
MGVYWEKQKPMSNGENLPAGLIRLVGRYWHKDSTYQLKLKATKDNGDKLEIIIKVNRPHRLITGNPTHTYESTYDVTGRPLNIDSLCIVHGGSYGIPPQIIKGQMFKESDIDRDNHRINPTYRYEPFEDIRYQNNATWNQRYFGSPNCFVVTTTSMGAGDPIPENHNNVHPVTYPINPISINIFIANNIWEYVQRATRRVFYSTEAAGRMNVYLTQRYNFYVTQNPRARNNFNRAVADLAERCRTGGFNELNRPAQTRIMSSYGFLQQTHYNAAEPGHQFGGFTRTAADHPPELLNEQNYNMPTYFERMDYYTSNNRINLIGNNWNEGYERRWESALSFYNSGESGYQTAVLRNSLMFLPQ